MKDEHEKNKALVIGAGFGIALGIALGWLMGLFSICLTNDQLCVDPHTRVPRSELENANSRADAWEKQFRGVKQCIMEQKAISWTGYDSYFCR